MKPVCSVAMRQRPITEFRYQLVAELANPYLSATKRRELIRQKRSSTRCRSSVRAATRWAASTSGWTGTASAVERVRAPLGK